MDDSYHKKVDTLMEFVANLEKMIKELDERINTIEYVLFKGKE